MSEPRDLGPDIQEPDVGRVAAADRVPTAAEAAADADWALKFRGHTRVDSLAKRLTDAIAEVLQLPMAVGPCPSPCYAY